MKKIQISGGADQTMTAVLVEQTAFTGVKRVVNTVANDLLLVTGKKPQVIADFAEADVQTYVLAATIGSSALLASLEEQKKIDLSPIRGKRECYTHMVLEDYPKEGTSTLVIAGSDKRGTIYGLFGLSEKCGVSPLVYFGDAKPVVCEDLELSFDGDYYSKEPSVFYRGFFINDEWPAFGNWATDTFGDVNAKAYDHIFELVLRLKGNYLWPAMWNSSFWQDGPDLENAILADEYGVIMGTSHHEPCIRAGVEWQRQYQNYGNDNTWSFISNAEAITAFWRDGLKRAGHLENVITIGMRGENDSNLLGEDATLQDNINVVKSAIKTQNQLIAQEVNEDLTKVPRMLAIYKEVEDFYFGDGDYDGLKGYEELEDVILLLSDDNHGHVRAIPQVSDAPHPGGFGMYYHFDYHGGPVSYEWLNHTNLTAAWEQLCMSYEAGIQKMWIVNVGDLKNNEYPLSFFMNLAYDYEKWGVSNLNSPYEFTAQWLKQQFPGVDEALQEQLHTLVDGYTKYTTLRIPEALNEDVFQNRFGELERLENEVLPLIQLCETLKEKLPKDLQSAYDSMLYYQCKASFNNLLIAVYSAKNKMQADRGILSANETAKKLALTIKQDGAYVDAFHKVLNGKWNHMMRSAHFGFRSWDAHQWVYPNARTVFGHPTEKIMISFRGEEAFNVGKHWQDRGPICTKILTTGTTDSVILDIDSRGNIPFSYEITTDVDWLEISPKSGRLDLQEKVTEGVTLHMIKEPETEQAALITVLFCYDNGAKDMAEAKVVAGRSTKDYPNGTFVEADGVISMAAAHFYKNVKTKDGGFEIIRRLGREQDAIRTFPMRQDFTACQEKPYVEYQFAAKQAGTYELTFFMAPRNPGVQDGSLMISYSLNEEAKQTVNALPAHFRTGDSGQFWGVGVLENMRTKTLEVSLQEGLNTLRIYGQDVNFILEHLLLTNQKASVKRPYLLIPESFRC